MRLNIGCGNDKQEGWLNADASPLCNPDVVCVLGTELPFEDNQFYEVRVLNVLCQIQSNEEFVTAINELWRVTKDTGEIHVRVPIASDIIAYQDPMDCRRFTPESFSYMQHEHRRYEQYGKHYGFNPFMVKLDNSLRQMLFTLTPVKV